MDEVKYTYLVTDENGKTLGIFEELGLALVFVNTYYLKFYNEPELQIRITRTIEGSLD